MSKKSSKLSLMSLDIPEETSENDTELIPEDKLYEYVEKAQIDNDFIKKSMREIRNNVNNNDKIEIKNKIKQHISQCLNPLTHGKRRFTNPVGEYNTPIHVSYICTFPNTIFKLINCEQHYVSDFTIMKEIAFQYYAKYLSTQDEEKCDFKVPEIISYGRVIISRDEYPEYFISKKFGQYGKYNCFWFIEMERLNYDSLADSLQYIDLSDQNTCDSLSQKLKSLNNCLKNKDFFHNDYHAKNIFYDRENDKLGLIDYGISDLSGILDTKPGVNYTCDLLRDIKNNPQNIGGRKYKSRKYKSRKYKSRKYKSRKYKSRKYKSRKYKNIKPKNIKPKNIKPKNIINN